MTMNYTQQTIRDLSREIMAVKPDINESELDEIMATLIGGIIDSDLHDRLTGILEDLEESDV